MVRVGSCSWAEKTLIQSKEFYPKEARTAEARLRHYAGHFDVVEVDSTYYAIPLMQTAALWAERTPPGFVFHIKAYAGLTGHGVDPRTLPAALQRHFEGKGKEERHVYITDQPILAEVAERFSEGIRPLRRAGKLGVLLFQFPPWFSHSLRNLDFILTCKNLIADLPIAVEFRHGSWLLPEKRESLLSFLRDNGIIYVAADEPQYGDLRTVPYLPETTGETAYFRFHGRNTKNWFRKGIDTALRYAYEYTDDELKEFIPSIRTIERKTKVTYLMFNNCYMAGAIKNAMRMRELLKQEKRTDGEGRT